MSRQSLVSVFLLASTLQIQGSWILIKHYKGGGCAGSVVKEEYKAMGCSLDTDTRRYSRVSCFGGNATFTYYSDAACTRLNYNDDFSRFVTCLPVGGGITRSRSLVCDASPQVTAVFTAYTESTCETEYETRMMGVDLGCTEESEWTDGAWETKSESRTVDASGSGLISKKFEGATCQGTGTTTIDSSGGGCKVAGPAAFYKITDLKVAGAAAPAVANDAFAKAPCAFVTIATAAIAASSLKGF